MIGGVILFVFATTGVYYGDSSAMTTIMLPNMAVCQSVGARIKEDIARQAKTRRNLQIVFTCQDIRP